MTRYVIGRLAQFVPVLLLSSFLIFMILHLAPGDPASLVAGEDASPEAIAQVRRELGLDRPVVVQFIDWLGGVLTGDLGTSYVNGQPAAELIMTRVGPTLQLALTSILIAVVIAIPLGCLAAMRPNGVVDRLVTTLTALPIAIPNFWLAIIGILVFALYLGILPAGGYASLTDNPGEAAKYLILPAFALASDQMAILIRYCRTAMIEALSEDYIRTAVAKGISRVRVVVRHGLRNALIPVVTMLGIMLGHMLSGAVIIEAIFAWPGLGRLLVQSILNRDYLVVQGILLLMVAWFALINLIVDLVYGGIDPRIRLGRREVAA
ncbi:ABC transporter permease [Jiangella asiatica]|uniref:ABC transporter permease n=1 Tax=Jiangella asiatica TaxID=2530372 RepID=A0A4R5DDR5_9ACTN|nr:ABC transporter permease [Jiangella asiatica]TDE11207.1 ABC transporter permease [Jiangella asiatica]